MPCFPVLCLLCGGQGSQHHLCSACFLDLPSLPNHCRQCARFFTFHTEEVCGQCLIKPPPFERTFALFPYQPPIIKFITALKFHHELAYAKLFSTLFIQKISQWYQKIPLPQVIVPVPLHKQRLNERGFNQALEIAKPLARHYPLFLDFLGTKRVKATLPQSQLSAKNRGKNLKNAFKACVDYKDATIAVVDDVMTTGHTMLAFCHLLKQSGAKTIHVWCCARKG